MMILRLNNTIRFAVAITNRVNSNSLAAVHNRFEFLRQCTTLSTNDSAINLKKILQKVQNEKYFDAFQSLQILRSCVSSTAGSVNREMIESIWTELKNKSEINEEHYLQLMKYYESIGKLDEILMLFDEICALGLKLRSAGYMIAFRAHLEKKDTKETWKFLSTMENANVCMNENSLHAVLGYFLRKSDYQLANKAIELIKHHGFELDFNILTKQWKTYARNGDIKSIQNSLNFFVKYDVSLRLKDMVGLIYELSAHGYSQHVNNILIYLDNVKGMYSKEIQATNRYIEGGQAHILPKLFHAIGMKLDKHESNLLSLMEQLEVPHQDFEQTKQNFQLISPLSDSESGKMDSREKVEGNDVFHVEDGYFRKLIRKRDVTGVELLLNRGNLNMTMQKYSAVIELYIENMQVEKALETFEKAIAVGTSFRLNPKILFELIKQMVQNEYDFEKIKEVLKIHKKPKAYIYRSRELTLYFQELAESGQAEILSKLYDAITENNIVEERTLYPPLIAVHLANNNLNVAVDTYEKFINTKNVAPYTVELMSFFIERNEMELLQRVYKIYEGAVKTNIAQYRLALAYSGCGHEEKARSILENVNMIKSKQFMFRECKLLENLGKVEETEALLRLTKGLPFDRHLIYRTLLELYYKTEQIKKIINLWTEHEADETAKPDKNFVGRLIHVLKGRDIKTTKLSVSKLQKMYKNM